MGTQKDLSKLSDAQFEKEWTKAAKAFDEAREECRRFSAENDRRVTERQARERVEAMTDTERQALLQEIKAQGIESEEKVGEV